MRKTNFVDRRLLCVRSCAAEFQRQKQKFRQTQQLEAETNERHRDDVVSEECHVVGHEHTASVPTPHTDIHTGSLCDNDNM